MFQSLFDIKEKQSEIISSRFEDLEKGRKSLPVGTIKSYKNQQYIKTYRGWKPYLFSYSFRKLEYAPSTTLPRKYAQIEAEFATDLSTSYEDRKKQYLRQFGKVINTDNARELSPIYNSNRGEMSAAVHEPASAFVKEVYKDLLKQPPISKKVVFTAGGTGAGKTTAIESIASANQLVQYSDVIYDSNMNGFQSSFQRIEQALQSGRAVKIIYVHRDPVEAFENGVIPRMLRMGRSVPIDAHIDTHLKSLDTVKKIATHYKDNPNVDFSFIDNSRGKGNAAEVSVVDLKTSPYSRVELKNILHESIQKKLEEGKITHEQYKGFTN